VNGVVEWSGLEVFRWPDALERWIEVRLEQRLSVRVISSPQARSKKATTKVPQLKT
jgi:hypothetical protein